MLTLRTLAFCWLLLVSREVYAASSGAAVVVVDASQAPVPAAQVRITQHTAQGTVTLREGSTDGSGTFAIPDLPPGDYDVQVSGAGFAAVQQAMHCSGSANQEPIKVTLMQPEAHKEAVTVEGKETPVAEGSAKATTISAAAVSQLPGRPATVADALPLVPGVVRTPQGGLQISGAGEQRSAFLVNSADVTDPATGQFGLTVPIDSVETISVFQAPYLAEYGQFSAGLVSVQTKRGGDQWKWDLNDPLPDFRIRSRHLDGVKDATPRLNFEGPLIKGKLYFSEGLEYQVREIESYTLTYPNNQSRQQGFNTFSQLDWVVSDRQIVTGTVQAAPEQQKYVNINFLNPEEASPNYGRHDYVATVADRISVGGGIWETVLSGTRFDAHVWGQGFAEEVIAPWGNSGNYFEQQNRTASRMGLSSTFAFGAVHFWGTHNFKAGASGAGSSDTGQVTARPVDILGASGSVAETIGFTGGRPYGVSDTEYSVFVQDHWGLGSRFAVDLGIRTESQAISEAVRTAPRAGFAWTPFAHAATVVRGGVGVFFDRVPLNVYAFPSYPQQVQTFFNADGSVAAGPFVYQNVLGEVPVHTRLVSQEQIQGDFSPRSTTWSIEAEQPIGGAVKLRAGYLETMSTGLVLLNPVAPLAGASSGFDLLSPTGSSRYRQLEVTARVRVPGPNPLYVSYVRSRAQGDLNEFSGYLGSFPAPVLRPNQYANLPSDLPNRYLAWGNIKLPHGFWISPVLEYRSGFPYASTDALQQYAGIPYRKRFPDFFSADSRVSKDLRVTAKYAARLSLSFFNITDHFNPEGLHTNIADPAYLSYLGQRGRRYTVDFDVLY